MSKKNSPKAVWIADRVNGIDCVVRLIDGKPVALGLHDPAVPVTVGAVVRAKVNGYNKSIGGYELKCPALPYSLLLKAPHTAYRGGDEILCQIESYPDENGKLPIVTTEIRLVGYYSVFLPYGNDIYASREIDKRTAENLKDTFYPVLDELSETGGLILRHACVGTKTSVIAEELTNLVAKWKETEQSGSDVLFAGVTQPCDILMRFYVPGEIIEFSREFMNGTFENAAQAVLPSPTCVLKDKPFENNNIFDFLHYQEDNSVSLSDGLSIVIEKGRTLTAIDVNNAGKRDILTANLDAAAEIARQIRLRSLAGTIIIDFIRMREPHDRDDVRYALEELLPPDHSTFHGGFTRLGLYELSLKRLYPPQSALLSEILR